MTQLNPNRIIAILIFLMSIGYLWMAFQIPTFPIPRPVDSDAFPKILGWTLMLLSIFLFFEKSAVSAEKEEEPAQVLSFSKRPAVQVAVTGLAIVIYAFSIEPLGFLLSSILLGFGLAYWYGYRKHFVNLGTMVTIVLSLYLLLNKVMGIHLPQGILPL
ncbi:tripartite tricarboxylate transporter TctB family protein [Nitrincola tibetensis]|uniref:Tripartite tricarboxylate transporter TctB family protein n=1 Tax=Nitrincola tibetensis TaxID=2219697 RepID=A0A364NJR8_9GAMM|nr:tripartite tricarboxylate transporter TctB family protein [Nitrincola tibetensis]RAU17316.1 tripartite tricarboxylate transporter TctB family protein [Nitrincola tibetensis]